MTLASSRSSASKATQTEYFAIGRHFGWMPFAAPTSTSTGGAASTSGKRRIWSTTLTEGPQGGRDVVDLVVAQLGVQRQAEDVLHSRSETVSGTGPSPSARYGAWP